MTKMELLLHHAESMENSEEKEALNDLLETVWDLHYVLGHFGHRMIASLIQHAGPNMVLPRNEDVQSFSEAIEFLRHINQDVLEEANA